jgi:hypothetical protein
LTHYRDIDLNRLRFNLFKSKNALTTLQINFEWKVCGRERYRVGQTFSNYRHESKVDPDHISKQINIISYNSETNN